MSSRSLKRLILFTRYPKPGTTKTRMIPELGAEGAALLQRQMTEHIFSSVTRFAALQSIAVQVRYEGGSQKRMRGWLGAKFDYRPQGGGDIGIRMARALGEGFEDGCQAVVIIGSDIPGISSDILKSAFNSLANQDLVLGPAADGGYYLIGMRRSALNRATPRIFGGIQWGTDAVLSQTLAIARDLKLKYRLLDTLKDVDRPDDIAVWHRAMEQRKKTGKISVIIPTLNEAG
ncbi:MAG: TIGR04282 family arsenosugar biosynthesis glycosyltransferase, partial [Desulfobacterales bacterium]